MPTCQFPGCTEDTPTPQHKYCHPHRKTSTKIHAKKAKERYRARRRDKDVVIFRCQADGCDAEVPNGRISYCPECRVKKARAQQRVSERKAAERNKSEVTMFEPWEPKPKVIIITDEEQRKIDAEILMRERLRCGCTHSPVRLLPREEVEQLQRVYEEAKFVREEVILPWSKRCAAEPKGTSLRRP